MVDIAHTRIRRWPIWSKTEFQPNVIMQYILETRLLRFIALCPQNKIRLSTAVHGSILSPSVANCIDTASNKIRNVCPMSQSTATHDGLSMLYIMCAQCRNLRPHTMVCQCCTSVGVSCIDSCRTFIKQWQSLDDACMDINNPQNLFATANFATVRRVPCGRARDLF
jgi:hypothetical protein